MVSSRSMVRDLAFGRMACSILECIRRRGRRADLQVNATGVKQFFVVPLSVVTYFAGDFAFGPDGTLYVSQGNIDFAGICMLPVEGSCSRCTSSLIAGPGWPPAGRCRDGLF